LNIILQALNILVDEALGVEIQHTVKTLPKRWCVLDHRHSTTVPVCFSSINEHVCRWKILKDISSNGW
jgi:hypothetical protein